MRLKFTVSLTYIWARYIVTIKTFTIWSTINSSFKAFTILFQAPTLLAMASCHVTFINTHFHLESRWIPITSQLDRFLSDLGGEIKFRSESGVKRDRIEFHRIVAVDAITRRTIPQGSKAFTVSWGEKWEGRKRGVRRRTISNSETFCNYNDLSDPCQVTLWTAWLWR